MTALPRPLTVVEARPFRLARLRAVENMPYFARALFAVVPLALEGLGTFAVDEHWRLYMDPTMLLGPAAWSHEERAAVLLHEIGHLLRDHAGRADQLAKPHDHYIWNLAGDAEINDDLIAARIPLPEGVVTPAALNLKDGDLAEAYYAALLDGTAPLPPPDPGDPGCGSGAGVAPIPGQLPDNADEPEQGISEAEASMVRRAVARDVKAALSTGRGTVPAGLDRWADVELAAPTVSWARVLRATMRRAVAAYAGRTDYTYRRPSRRRVAGVILPAMRSPRVNVSLVVDTSGSMSTADLTAALGEIQGVLRASMVDRANLRVLSCDAHAATATRVRSIASITLKGGGGTDMRVGIDAATKSRPRPHVVVVLTDGDTPWPDAPLPGTDLVCIVISARPPVRTPVWAKTVHVLPQSVKA